MSVLVFLLAAASSVLQPSVCREGALPDAMPVSPEVRRLPNLNCDYGRSELHKRLSKMLNVERKDLSIDTVRRIFSLPKQPRQIDARRFATYNMTLLGKDEIGPWKAWVGFDESFPPIAGSEPAMFRGGGNPVRIGKDQGELTFDFQLAEPLKPGSPACLRLRDFLEQVRKAGWHLWKPEFPPFSPHPSTLHNLIFTRDNLRLSFTVQGQHVFGPTSADIDAACVEDMKLTSRLPSLQRAN